MQRRVMDPGVVPVALHLGQEEALFARPPGGQQGLAGVTLPVGQGLGQGLVARLGEEENADDADEGATGEDDVVKEVALLVVELHDGGGQHAEASAGEHQAQTPTPTERDKDHQLGSHYL